MAHKSDLRKLDKFLRCLIIIASLVCGTLTSILTFLTTKVVLFKDTESSFSTIQTNSTEVMFRDMSPELVAFMGLFHIVASLAGIVGGSGFSMSKKWGFKVVGVVFGLLTVEGLFQFPNGLDSKVGTGLVCVYCVMRLTGKWGEKPA